MEEIKKKIEELEQELHVLYYDGYMDNSKEVKEKQKEIRDAYLHLCKEDANQKNNKDTKENPELEEDEEDLVPPPLPDLPTIDLSLNKKTGECVIVERNNPDKIFDIKMDSRDYTRAGLKTWKKIIETNEKIAKEDIKYIENIDPTLYNAYKLYDMENKGKYNESAAKMYVDCVISQSKGKPSKTVRMPGKVNIDIGWHPEQNNERGSEKKFGITRFLSSLRASKILSHHGKNKNGMNLADVKNNKKKLLTFGALLASSTLLLSDGQSYSRNDDTDTKTEISSELKDKKENTKTSNDKQKNQETNTPKEKQEKTKRIYPGDVVTVEQYSQLYKSADSKKSNDVFNHKKMIGVNKISCVIDGKLYSTATHDADEIYKMAEKAGAMLNYHIDEAVDINGKICVQVNEKGNPAPIYIYNDNGETKKLSGGKWKGDVEYGIGWIHESSIHKADLKNSKTEDKKGTSYKNNTKQKLQETERI